MLQGDVQWEDLHRRTLKTGGDNIIWPVEIQTQKLDIIWHDDLHIYWHIYAAMEAMHRSNAMGFYFMKVILALVTTASNRT